MNLDNQPIDELYCSTKERYMQANTTNETDLFRLLDQFFGEDGSKEDVLRAMSLLDDLPEELWAFRYGDEDKFYCVTTPGLPDNIDGITCLTMAGNENLAKACLAAMDDDLAIGCDLIHLTRDEALSKAQSKAGVTALLVVHEPERLRIQFVR